jgi:HlyD family secretion protein
MDKKKKRIIAVVAILAITGVAVKLVFFREEFLYAGTIEATEVDVPARVSSVISTRDVDEGTHVKANQILMHLSCEDVRLAANIADENFARSNKLYKEGSQSKENLDQLKNRKEDADLRVAWCSVASPLTGVVLNKYHEAGEWVTPGTRLFTLADLREVWANIYVPQSLIAKLSPGQSLTGYLPELKMQGFEGTISRISDTAEFTPKNVQTREERTRLIYAIKITFKNPKEILKPGMSIEVKIPE